MTPSAASPVSSVRLALWCGALVFAVAMGVRLSLAIFLGPINTATGLGIGAVSLAFAVGQLAWGIAQPIAGAIADRHGSGRTVAIGAAMIAVGTALVPWADSTWALVLTIGVLGAGGAGFAGPSVVMAAVARTVPPERRGMANGIVNAGGSLGQFAIAPLAGALLVGVGMRDALLALALLSLAIAPLAWGLRGRAAAPAAGAGAATAGGALRAAARDRSYLLLSAGFFTCGFHVAFLATHLPGVVEACGLPPTVGAWSLALIGLANVAGSLGIGWAVGRWRSRSLLASLYAARAVIVVAFIAAPKTPLVFALFSIAIGLTYLSTVPPTAALVAKLHGVRWMATLFGIVMLSHQVGGFLGAWLGGRVFEATGGYDAMWAIDALLAVGAALLHLPIREARPTPPARTAAA